ncbi:LP14331p [Strongyloides ratti]|uniref:LP14331p n=1 Tax=Strongyloides ratti TaxID=34506 RepID=A0A090MNB2_STRRB|nr:LP14331p [Strongyloides ratti]CEF59561.1 LP14331p [Strongyloides ratti]
MAKNENNSKLSETLGKQYSDDIMNNVEESLKETIKIGDLQKILKNNDKEFFYEDNENEKKNDNVLNESSSDSAEIEYEKNCLEKFFDFIFCRSNQQPLKFKEKPVPTLKLFKFGSYSDIVLVIIGCILSFICGIFQPIFSILTGKLANTLLIDDIHSETFIKECIKCIIFFIITGILLSTMAFLQFLVFNIACVKIVRKLRCAFLNSIIKQDAAWFEKNHSGTLNTKLNDNIERICEGIGDKFGLLLRNSCQFIAGLCVAFYTSWRMTLPLCILSPTVAFFFGLTGKLMMYYTKEEMNIYSSAGKIALEAIGNVTTVASLNGQKEEVKKYEKLLDEGKKKGIKKGLVNSILFSTVNLIILTFVGASIFYGSFLYKYGYINTPGEIFIVILCLLSGAYHLGLASPHMMVILTARVAAATIYKTIDRKPDIDSSSSVGKTLYDVKGKIEFKNVTFSYPTSENIKTLKNLSIKINPGETVALVGHSGSGKSTIASILTRLYDYNDGIVTIDDVDIKQLNIKWLRTCIGIVQQIPVILNRTIKENLKIGNSTLTHDQMVEACKIANAHEFIMKLANGYDTYIGDGGVQLSGGQCQRICIARAIARNPKILILDEATSALDSKSESIVQDALNKASKGRSTLIIAHRLATIRKADRIYVLDKGEVLETGTHNELLELNGTYTNYVNSQLIEDYNDDNDIDDVENNETINLNQNEPIKKSLNPFIDNNEELNSFLNKKTIKNRKSKRKTIVDKGDNNNIDETFKNSIRQKYNREFKKINTDIDAEGERLEEEIKSRGTIQVSLLDVLKIGRSQWITFGIATGISALLSSTSPFVGLLYGLSFSIYEDGNRDHVTDATYLCFANIIYAIYESSLSCLASYLFAKVGENITKEMRIKSFTNILYQDSSFFDNPRNTPGKLITRLATDAPNVKAAMDSRFSKVVRGILSLISSIVFAVLIDWKLGICGAFMFSIQGILQVYLARLVHKHNHLMIEKDEAGKLAVESLEKIKTIQLLTAEDIICESYIKYSKIQQTMELKKAPLLAINYASTHGMQQLTQAVCYSVGLIFVLYNISQKSSIFQVIQLLYFGSTGIISASELFPEIVKSRLSASLMMELINAVPKTGNPNEGKKNIIEGDININDVYFAYPQRKNYLVLKNFNLSIKKGQSVALVGCSGSGKSTIISLIERFYDPCTGIISIDKNDTTKLNLIHLRSQMGLVGQMPKLFSGTIRENILYGLDHKDYTIDDVKNAAIMANASTFIESLPNGYEQEVGEKGSCLSGGQAQRIAIARALIRNPKILLLDEATSALDSASEKSVQIALEKASGGRTTIHVAHRISSIQNCDLIICMDNGEIKEMGNHKQLIAMNGLYAELIQKQDLGKT